LNLPNDIPFSLLKAAPNLGAENCDFEALINSIRLEETKQKTKYNVIILDTLARVIPGRDENSSKDAGLFVSAVEKLSRALNALIIVVHHSGKNADAGLRGSSAFVGAADTIISIKNYSDYHWVQIEKQREGASEYGFSFKLKQVEIGTDNDEAVTTCVISDVTCLQPSNEAFINNKKQQRSTKYGSKFNQLFNETVELDNRDFVLEDGTRVKGVLKSVLIEKFQDSYPNNKRESNIKAFSRCIQTSQEKGCLNVTSVDVRDLIYKLP
jgi:RecA-family ATPase